MAQLALERDVPLEQDGRVAELAPDGVRSSQVGRRDHLDRAIAEGSGEAQGFLPESDGPVVVAGGLALAHHEVGDQPEPVLVAEHPRESLGLAEVLAHARPLAERKERVPEVKPGVDGQLGRLPGRGETAEGLEYLREEYGPL